jgi:hypothetical protein
MKPVQLNQRLVEKQGLSQEEVWKIQDLHNVRRQIELAMEKTIDPGKLHALFQDWTWCQFELQKAWKFKEDANYHKGWLVPNCGCPVLDNEDRYPHGPYVINLSCPVHSKETLS